MDADTTATRDAHERLLRQFGKPGPAVLLGTQMIAKGLDFNDVVLVGVINADTQLKLPDFRSAERTFALIEQVAGRAGRGDFEGRVLVQTYLPESYAIQSAAAYDRRRFLLDELPKRKLLRYPPYARLANILVWGDSSSEVREVAQALAVRVDEVIRDVVGQRVGKPGRRAVCHRAPAWALSLAHPDQGPCGCRHIGRDYACHSEKTRAQKRQRRMRCGPP